ncbi:MAG: aminopeptidase P family protein [Alphaproteobacteria bacterium HGW-Alphaproteobacteria-8]|nr:MAG: aminopeptidase P family protein [Alphaproteobacteria bacterium HGW-Alphaproteobacteria-8]
MTTDRYAGLRAVIAAQGLDAAALVPGANFRRLFGWEFHQNERPLCVLVPREGAPVAVVPALEAASFDALGFEGARFLWSDAQGCQGAFDKAAEALGESARIGVEGQRMRVFERDALAQAFGGAEIVNAHAALSSIRLCKSADEIAQLRTAIAVSETALETTLAAVRVGMTEKQVEALLLAALFAAGAEALSFGPIVAAGANAAQPHAKARADYAIRPGDALLLDFGASHGGYCADITRTVFVAQVSDSDRALYETVRAANEAGRAAAVPGATAGDVDDAALRVLEASPFAALIRHKTGHGLGLEVHEDPYILRGNGVALTPGMVFTVEPGLYRHGAVGVRIEDDVVMTATGSETLTHFPRALRLVG